MWVMRKTLTKIIGGISLVASSFLPLGCIPSEDQGVNDARLLGFGLAGIAATTNNPDTARAAALGADLANRRGDDLASYHAAREGRSTVTVNVNSQNNDSKPNVTGPIIVVDGEKLHYVDENGKWYYADRNEDKGTFFYVDPSKGFMSVPSPNKGFISMNR